MQHPTAGKTRFSVIPLEFASKEHCNRVRSAFAALSPPEPANHHNVLLVYETVCGRRPHSVLGIAIGDDSFGYIAFEDSSACAVIESIEAQWPITEDSIRTELRARADLHRHIIRNEASNPLRQLCDILEREQEGSTSLGLVNYVFTFYCFDVKDSIDHAVDLLSMMAEPSLIDLSDMESDSASHGTRFKDSKREFLGELVDCDISGLSRTYVTWATIVSINQGDKDAFMRTTSLLLALELRLQSVWNRTFALSAELDDIFASSRIHNLSRLYVSLSSAIDSAKSLQSATLSSRAKRFLQQMVATSRLSEECDRLERKIALLEKFLAEKQSLHNDKYMRVVQALLVLLAIGQVVPLFFPIPLTHDVRIGDAVIAAMVLIGGFAITRMRRTLK